MTTPLDSFIWSYDKTALLKTDDISSIEFDSIYRIKAIMLSGESYIIGTAKSYQDVMEKIADWKIRLSHYYAKKKW